MSGSNYCFLTCIQIFQEAGKVVWYSHLFKNFLELVVIHTIKGFSVVTEAKLDVFLEFSCFFYDPTDVDNLICGSSAFSKSSLSIRKFAVHLLLKPGLENFEHHFARPWDECNCVVVWAFFGIAFLGIGMKTDLFQWTISKIKTVQQQQQKSTIDLPGEQRRPKIISTRTKLTKV